MSSPAEMDVIQEKVKAFCQSLTEHHLVSVRVFVTKTETGLAKSYNHGGGDWYSTYGAIREWLLQQDERSKINVQQEERGED